MKSFNLKPFFFLSAFIIIGGVFSASAESLETNTSPASKVEISFPVEKNDFLLFYGVTPDKDTNTKIINLRKDFTSKFEALKNDYQKSFQDIVGNRELTPGNLLENNEEPEASPVATGLKSIKIDPKSESKTVKNLEVPNVVTVKKYILDEAKDSIISPVVNLINNKPNIKTETSSWFQKIKSWFGW